MFGGKLLNDFQNCFQQLFQYYCLFFQPVLAFAGEHCHPSFYSTAHGAYLTGRSAAQFFINNTPEEEDVYNLGSASVADLSTWLEEISVTEKDKLKKKLKRTSRRVAQDVDFYQKPL